MSERLGLDNLPRVTEDEALELCVHHLQLAACYAMNIPDDLKAVLTEAERIVNRDNTTWKDNPGWKSVEAFLKASWRAHEIVRRRGMTVQIAQSDTPGQYSWWSRDDDHKIVASGGPFMARALASLNHDNWVNLADEGED